jgi:hypothetical protein
MSLKRKCYLQLLVLCLTLLILIVLTDQILAESRSTDSNISRDIDKRAKLIQHLQELIHRLRQERSAYYTQKAQHDIQMQKARQNLKILQDELDDLHRQEAELNQQLRKYEIEVENSKEQLVLIKNLQNVIRQQIKPFILSQRATIENGIPYKLKERIARLEAVSNILNDPNLVSVSDQLGHVWNYAQEEFRLSRSPETYTSRAPAKDGSTPYARYFRVGQLILGYVTEDGRQTAIWSSLLDNKGWQVITDQKQSSQVRNAVEILDRRQAPKLVVLPIVLQNTDSN